MITGKNNLSLLCVPSEPGLS